MSDDEVRDQYRASAATLMWETALWAAGEGRLGREPREVADQASRLFVVKMAEYDVESDQGQGGP